MDINKLLGRDRWDKNRGLNKDAFGDALEKAAAGHGVDMSKLYDTPHHFKNGTPVEDPYSHLLKPKGVPVWNHPPATPAEEALYYGVHIHSESNPLGLHTHVPGGGSGGAHSHSPSNRFGTHHHKTNPGDMTDVDGHHEHGGVNYPDGKHDHHPENFG